MAELPSFPASAQSAVAPHAPADPSPALRDAADSARAYAAARTSANTARAYDSDWRQYRSWCRRNGLDPQSPDPRAVGLFLAASADGAGTAKVSAATIERRLAAITAHFRTNGVPLDRSDRHIADVLAGIRRSLARPPQQKEALLAEDVLAMLDTLPHDLRGLRDRAILLIGFAGGLRRSEIVGLDCGPEQSRDGSGWIERLDGGLLLTLRGKTGWRVVEIGRGSTDRSCPLTALDTWLRLAKIAEGAVFRRLLSGLAAGSANRLTDRHVARLVKTAALQAGIRSDLPEAERAVLFAGHSLRAGIASSGISEADAQRHLGHASVEMTRRYQRRRERFRVNLTRAAGL